MHTTTLGMGWSANHNSDFSGTVRLADAGTGREIDVPFNILLKLIAEYVRRDRMHKLEQATLADLLMALRIKVPLDLDGPE